MYTWLSSRKNCDVFFKVFIFILIQRLIQFGEKLSSLRKFSPVKWVQGLIVITGRNYKTKSLEMFGYGIRMQTKYNLFCPLFLPNRIYFIFLNQNVYTIVSIKFNVVNSTTFHII